MRLGKRFCTTEGMGGNASDRPCTVADGNADHHPRLILVPCRHQTAGGGGARLEATGVEVEKLRISTRRVVTHQHLDTARLEQADGDVNQFLDVVNADHEAKGIGPFAGRGRGNSTTRGTRRIDRQRRVDDGHRFPARPRKFHSSTDRDIAGLSRPLEECRQFPGRVQIDALRTSRASARRGKQYRHAPVARTQPLLSPRGSTRCRRAAGCRPRQRLLRGGQQRGPQQTVDVRSAFEHRVGENQEILLVDSLRRMEQPPDFQQRIQALVNHRPQGLDAVPCGPLELLEVAGLQFLPHIP
jgi:hypothetical protein